MQTTHAILTVTPAPNRRIVREVVRKRLVRTKGTGESGADLLLLPSVLTLAEEARQKGECGMGEAAARVEAASAVLSSLIGGSAVAWWSRVINSMRPTMSVVEIPSVRGIVRYLPARWYYNA